MGPVLCRQFPSTPSLYLPHSSNSLISSYSNQTLPNVPLGSKTTAAENQWLKVCIKSPPSSWAASLPGASTGCYRAVAGWFMAKVKGEACASRYTWRESREDSEVHCPWDVKACRNYKAMSDLSWLTWSPPFQEVIYRAGIIPRSLSWGSVFLRDSGYDNNS